MKKIYVLFIALLATITGPNAYAMKRDNDCQLVEQENQLSAQDQASLDALDFSGAKPLRFNSFVLPSPQLRAPLPIAQALIVHAQRGQKRKADATEQALPAKKKTAKQTPAT